nr:DUF177 domain-containing protein [Anaerolineae bacterium]
MKTPTASSKPLRINIGFLLKQSAGYCREIDLDIPGTLRFEDIAVKNLHGVLRLNRTPQGVLIKGVVNARTPVECARCLATFDYAYQIELSELFVPQEAADANANSEDNPFLIDDGDIIDLTPLMREETILSIPIHVVCSPTCKGLCAQCGQDLNVASCDCEADLIDPRLAPLQKLLDDLE